MTIPCNNDGVDVTLKLTTNPGVAPYAPECLIAAGGINTSTGVLTIDGTTFGGASGIDGFGQPGSAHGGAETFLPGYLCELIQLGVASPATPLAVTVVSVDTSGSPATITVTPAPDSTWAGYATDAVGVMLTFVDYGSATGSGPPSQHDDGFVANASAGSIVTGVQPDRWS